MNRGPVIATLLTAVMLLAACAVDPARQPGASYIVRRGDTLYSIAWRYDLDYKELARWNAIVPPYTIHPGQRLRMHPGPRPASASPPSTARAGTSARSGGARRATSPPRTTAPVPTAGAPAAALRWQWPTEGQVIRRFSADGAGKKGIAIAGTPGQPVRAAAAGKVVYSGGGLIGYGQLIIVNHNKNYLSAYAHNQRILVKEGDSVSAGQQIAELGSTGTDRPMLHFEIRLNGKPVDPLKYLPPR